MDTLMILHARLSIVLTRMNALQENGTISALNTAEFTELAVEAYKLAEEIRDWTPERTKTSIFRRIFKK